MIDERTPYHREGSRVGRQTGRGSSKGSGRYSHTLGSIIWLAMLRLIITIFVAWYLQERFVEYSEWWLVTVLAIYGIVIYPAQIQYEYFRAENRKLIEETLCSSCRHFHADNLHCTRLDEHVSEDYVPCNAEEWEPRADLWTNN